ncbi:MAG: hypothetical protein HYX24_04520 [Candidatus Aenigmarchaeota archaeon]|nr:hypothetical protein [Candidatus Aenigmarchaeota archaeon]
MTVAYRVGDGSSKGDGFALTRGEIPEGEREEFLRQYFRGEEGKLYSEYNWGSGYQWDTGTMDRIPLTPAWNTVLRYGPVTEAEVNALKKFQCHVRDMTERW